MNAPRQAPEGSEGALALSDSEFAQLNSLIARVSAVQFLGLLVSRLSLKQLFAIGSAIVGIVAVVFGLGYGLASLVAELKDTGTERKLTAKDAELTDKLIELKNLKTAQEKLTQDVKSSSSARDEAAAQRDQVEKILGFFHLLNSFKGVTEAHDQKRSQAIKTLQAQTKALVKEKLATPLIKGDMVVGVYVARFGEVLISNGFGGWQGVA